MRFRPGTPVSWRPTGTPRLRCIANTLPRARGTWRSLLVGSRRFGERRLLLGRGVLLMLRLPLLERLAVDDLAALVLGHRDALGVGRVLHPVRQAIPAEAGEVHHVDVLHVGAAAQVLDQAAVDGGFELGAGLVVHGEPPDRCAEDSRARRSLP